MKQIFAFLMLACVSLAVAQSCVAQSFDNQSAAIAAAFNNRNGTALSDHFCTKVELVLPGVDNTYSKAQAKSLIVEFFNKTQPKAFEILHQGSRANVSFIIAQLTVASTAYRVNMLFKKEGESLLIYQLRIE